MIENKKIKIGFLLNSSKIPKWQYLAIEKLNALPFTSLDLVLLNKSKKEKSKRRNLLLLKKAVYIIYEKLDNLIFDKNKDLFSMVDSLELFYKSDTLSIKPTNKGISTFISDKDLEKIKSYNLDVLVRFGFGILKGDIFNIPKYGVWSFHHGDNRYFRGSAPCFWEMYSSKTEIGLTLQELSNELDGGKVLYKSYSSLDKFSLSKNRNKIYANSIPVLERLVSRIFFTGELRFEKELVDIYDQPLYKNPTNIITVKFLFKLFYRILEKFISKIFKKGKWHLAYSTNSFPKISGRKLKTIKSPKGKFWADPFLLEKDSETYVFFEEYCEKLKRGNISIIKFDDLKQKNTHKSTVIIDEKFHLSYPNIFEKDGIYYIVPESSKANEIRLYECVEFPFKWKYKSAIMKNVRAWDPTLFFKDNKWWLFVNLAKHKLVPGTDELFLFYSDELFSNNWISHPLNPIITDVKKSRCAGKIFEFEDYIIRPSQNCGPRYGYGLVFNKILILTETDYKEEIIDQLSPEFSKKANAIHTFNKNENIIISDIHQ